MSLREKIARVIWERPSPSPDGLFEAMFRANFPPISQAEHLAAAERLNAPPLIQTLRFPDGSEMEWVVGTVDGRDYTRRDGYPVVIEGHDRFGWPDGHPDSPSAMLAASPKGGE